MALSTVYCVSPCSPLCTNLKIVALKDVMQFVGDMNAGENIKSIHYSLKNLELFCTDSLLYKVEQLVHCIGVREGKYPNLIE